MSPGKRREDQRQAIHRWAQPRISPDSRLLAIMRSVARFA
jgi:hypothetical protein